MTMPSTFIRFPTLKKIDNYLDSTAVSDIETALEEAQDIIYDAMESYDSVQTFKLIRKALKKSPLCADAYTLYFDISDNPPEMKLHDLQTALHVGKLAIKYRLPDDFDSYKGHFWGYLKTRPYMRAKCSLAICLWDLGRFDESISHFKEMLELNPNDNQGIRYILASHYLELEYLSELKELFNQFPEEYSPLLYTKTLLAFKKGLLKEATTIAHQAIKANPHVRIYLNLRVKQPNNLTGFVTLGREDEAIEYVNHNIKSWIRTYGAIDWLTDIQPQKD